MRVRSLGQEDPLEEDMATHSSILAWRILIDSGAWRATVHGVAKSQTRLQQLSTCLKSSVFLCANRYELFLVINPSLILVI